MKLIQLLIIILFITILPFTFCKKEAGGAEAEFNESPTAESKGVGPISKIELGEIDNAKVESGKKHFEIKCGACHKFDEKVVGPPLAGITERRSPEWIMNMILNPVEMTQKDPAAKELYETYLVQMTFQNVTEEESRDILEYFRQMDKDKK